MVLGIDERINGVNLGNWLVLEKWMDPEPFVRTAEDDEIWMHRTHGALWSERNLAEELRRHRDAYITLEDFRIIADHGLNLVRIPIPYFIFGDWPGHPGCIAYLDRAFRWARETGLKIMIDLHTVPGSQNGFDNGGLTGVCKWAQNPDLVEYALNVLERLARRYRDEPTLHSIEVLNEPVSWSVFHGTSNTAKDVREASGSTHIPLRFLKRFYRDAYIRLRTILRPETVIVFHDGFRLFRWGDWFRRAGMCNVMLDTPPISHRHGGTVVRGTGTPTVPAIAAPAMAVPNAGGCARNRHPFGGPPYPCTCGRVVRGEPVGTAQPEPSGRIPSSIAIATRGMGRVGRADLLELPACAFRETGQRRRETATRSAQRRQSRSVGSDPRMASWMDSSGCAPR